MKLWVGKILFLGGLAAAIFGLLWMIWLPVLTPGLPPMHDVWLPLAIGWTGCIASILGACLWIP